MLFASSPNIRLLVLLRDPSFALVHAIAHALALADLAKASSSSNIGSGSIMDSSSGSSKIITGNAIGGESGFKAMSGGGSSSVDLSQRLSRAVSSRLAAFEACVGGGGGKGRAMVRNNGVFGSSSKAEGVGNGEVGGGGMPPRAPLVLKIGCALPGLLAF